MHSWVNEALLCEPFTLDGTALSKIMPGCDDPDGWADLLSTFMPRYGVDSLEETALFLAQVGHESADLNHLEESLNYSVSALTAVFGRHRIEPTLAATLGRDEGQRADQPAIANAVYGGAWGARNLGNTEPTDGWKYRGRGLIQLTGRANYTRCAQDTGMDLVNDPDLLARDTESAVKAALWYWENHVPGQTVKTTTKQINGGYSGLDDRVARYRRAFDVLEA